MDVSKLPFDIDVISKITSKEQFLSTFPKIAVYEAFHKDLPIPVWEAFKFIVLLYSMGSPLVLSHYNAKQEAAQFLGYPVSNDEIQDEQIRDLLAGKNEEFNDMITAYCRYQKNAKFTMLVTYIDGFYKIQPLIRAGVTTKDDKERYKELLDNSERLEKKIDELVNEFLNKDNNDQIRSAVFSEAEKMSLGLRSEEIADKLERGENPLPGFKSPYGDDYNFDKFGDRKRYNPINDE